MGCERTCTICARHIEDVSECEHASVRSNIRKFINESFVVWRCPDCRSIHARDEVDLEYYYAHYPFHKLKRNLLVRHFYNKLLRRLARAGFRKHHRFIDYGCGSGLLVDHFQFKGFRNAAGYDAYSRQFNDKRVLSEAYDYILSQDVIEHVPDPWSLLRTFDRLAVPGGVIAIGTPNAAAIDLSRPCTAIHALHTPYHRTILSREALCASGREMGWELVSYYPNAYANTLIPCVNARMWFRYSRINDQTIDLAFEPPKFNLRLLTPAALFDAILGGFFCPELDIMAIFRKPL